MKKLPIALLLIVILSIFVSAQTDAEKREQERQRRLEAQRVDQAFEDLAKLSQMKTRVGDIDPTIKELYKEVSLSPEDRAKVTPAQEDFAKHAEFLKKRDTGLVKILLDPKCGSSLVVDINDTRCAKVFPLKGNGAYYSFRIGSHAETEASDIYYGDGIFRVGFKNQLLGILVDLGDSQIELLDKKDSKVEALKNLKVPKDFAKLNALKTELKNGIVQNGAKYFDNLKAKLNNTYLIRTVAYQFEEQAINDKRIDAVLAFRVVKIESDSITILWKGLNWKWSEFLR